MGKRFATDTPTWAELKAAKQPATRTVRLAMDPDLSARIEDLEREAGRARARNLDTGKIDKELAAVRARVEEDAVPFTFRALPRLAFETLREAHPSEDPAEQFDVESFGPALVAAASVSPVFTEGEALELWAEWGNAEVIALFGAAWAVQTETRSVPFGVPGTSRTPRSGSPSTTAPSEESPTPSS